MGVIEQYTRQKKDEVKQLLEYAFPFVKEIDGKKSIDSDKGVITVSDYDKNAVHNYYRLEILHALIVERFVKKPERLKIARELKEKFYLIPISKERKGRIEIFETIKAKYQRELEQERMNQPLRNI